MSIRRDTPGIAGGELREALRAIDSRISTLWGSPMVDESRGPCRVGWRPAHLEGGTSVNRRESDSADVRRPTVPPAAHQREHRPPPRDTGHWRGLGRKCRPPSVRRGHATDAAAPRRSIRGGQGRYCSRRPRAGRRETAHLSRPGRHGRTEGQSAFGWRHSKQSARAHPSARLHHRIGFFHAGASHRPVSPGGASSGSRGAQSFHASG